MSAALQPVRQLFEWVDTLPSSVALRESQYVWSWIVIAHVIGVCVFAGLLVMMDVRLVGAGHLAVAVGLLPRPSAAIEHGVMPQLVLTWLLLAISECAALVVVLLLSSGPRASASPSRRQSP